MHLVKVRLVKRETDDGFASVKDDVLLGKEYIIDIDSKRNQRMRNIDKHAFHEKVIVDTDDGCWLPFELLEIIQ